MAFTRKFLKSMGLTDEQVDSIMEEHVLVTDGLKEQVQLYKKDAERLPKVQKDLDDLKANTADYDEWKKKYEDEHTAYEGFKKNVEETEKANKVKSAYRALLKAQNIDEKRIDSILKVTNLAEKKLGEDGKFEDEKSIAESIKAEWKDFIVSTEERGTPVETPPANSGKQKPTKDEIMSIKDTEARQQAIAENIELFQ